MDYLFLEHQKRIVLSWLHWAWAGYREQRPETGQALILAGGAGIGKTLWANEVVGNLFGGSRQADQYVSGDDSFGGELFSVGLWLLEDTALTGDPRQREALGRRLKQFVASIRHREHSKFTTASYTDWGGRVIMSINDDRQSLLTAPMLDNSIRDKLIVLHLIQDEPFPFPRRHEMTDIIAEELPYFARYVNDWVIPDDLKGDARYGVREFIDASIEQRMLHASPAAGLSEVLNRFAWNYFSANPEDLIWIGSATALSLALNTDECLSRTLRVDSASLNRNLPKLVGQCPILEAFNSEKHELPVRCVDSLGEGLWVISRPAGFVPPEETAHAPKVATAQ